MLQHRAIFYASVLRIRSTQTGKYYSCMHSDLFNSHSNKVVEKTLFQIISKGWKEWRNMIKLAKWGDCVRNTRIWMWSLSCLILLLCAYTLEWTSIFFRLKFCGISAFPNFWVENSMLVPFLKIVKNKWSFLNANIHESSPHHGVYWLASNLLLTFFDDIFYHLGV